MGNSIEQRVERINSQLQKWRGGQAKLWSYFTSHGSLVIRIIKHGVEGNIHIRCIDTSRITSPTVWENCEIVLTHHEAGGFTLSDDGAHMKLEIGDINARENVKDG